MSKRDKKSKKSRRESVDETNDYSEDKMLQKETYGETPNTNSNSKQKKNKKSKNVELFDVDDLEAAQEVEESDATTDRDGRRKKKKDQRRSTVPPPSTLNDIIAPQTPDRPRAKTFDIVDDIERKPEPEQDINFAQIQQAEEYKNTFQGKMDIAVKDYKAQNILPKNRQEKCCQCISMKWGMILIIIIQSLDVFNLILFSLAVLPIASFQTQQMFMSNFEFLNVYRGAKPNSYGIAGGKTLSDGISQSSSSQIKIQSKSTGKEFKMDDASSKSFKDLIKKGDESKFQRPEEAQNADIFFYALVGVDGLLFLSNFYLFCIFSRYLFKQHFDGKTSYKDNYKERSKLVTALNVIIVKDLIHTIYLIIAMAISLGYLAIFAVPLPIFILVIKSGWTCYWKYTFRLYQKQREL